MISDYFDKSESEWGSLDWNTHFFLHIVNKTL